MPAIRKLTQVEVTAIEQEIKRAVTMDRKSHVVCRMINVARYTAQIDGTYQKGSK